MNEKKDRNRVLKKTNNRNCDLQTNKGLRIAQQTFINLLMNYDLLWLIHFLFNFFDTGMTYIRTFRHIDHLL